LDAPDSLAVARHFDDLEVCDLAPMAKQETVKHKDFRTDPLDEETPRQLRLVLESIAQILRLLFMDQSTRHKHDGTPQKPSVRYHAQEPRVSV